jgi:hypothetical protein
MNINEPKKVNLLPQYLFSGQHARIDHINESILERNKPETSLAPNFSPRPVLTRYARFPMLDNRMPTKVPIEANYNYSLEKTFTPPLMNVGPVSGFINNVEIETSLRNQDYALQKGNDEVVYIPSSQSDLYKVYIPSTPCEQPYPGLFAQAVFSKKLHPNVANNQHVGGDRFHNNTRTQLREMSSEP